MQIDRLSITDLVVIQPKFRGDDRGYFAETFRHDWFTANVADVAFVQHNQSLSRSIGTVRGLHFQTAPAAQGKLVRCVAGAIFDVAVDIRPGSSRFGDWAATILTAEGGEQLWIPPGFLHGFCTLQPDAIVAYGVTQYYDSACDSGVAWDDPEIGIDWPEVANPQHLSPKDATQPRFRNIARQLQPMEAS